MEIEIERKEFTGTFMVFVFVVGILLFSGCKKEDNGNAEEETLVPLQIGEVSLNVATGGSSASSWTKSGDWNWTGKSIGVFRMAGSCYSGTADNIKYSSGNSSGTSWSPSDNRKQIYLTKSLAKLRAYYPYDSSVGSDGNVTLTSRLYSEDKDLCCQKNDVSAAGGSPVSFNLKYIYSRFVFRFTRDVSYDGACAISKIKIENPGVISSDTYNLFTGKVGVPSDGDKGTVTISDVGISGIASGSTSPVYILMVPNNTALSGSLKFTFTIDGEDIIGTVDDASAFGLLAGTQYTFDVTIKSSAVEVTNTANCYMIAPGNSLIIPVNVKGNGNSEAEAGTGLDVNHTASSVGILWETSPDLISLNGFTSENQAVQITAYNATQTGTAVIAAYSGENQTGDILWSWHIWVTDYDPDISPIKNGDIYTIANANGSYIWMDRNLGATSTTPATVTIMGLLYQWGRKDPFPGASNYYLSENDVYTSLPI
ncbi:MAG: fimbrillin family protein [Bacteroidales bacterium]|nr:fimbrillin family protein [Bacteroidales bacterium]